MTGSFHGNDVQFTVIIEKETDVIFNSCSSTFNTNIIVLNDEDNQVGADNKNCDNGISAITQTRLQPATYRYIISSPSDTSGDYHILVTCKAELMTTHSLLRV